MTIFVQRRYKKWIPFHNLLSHITVIFSCRIYLLYISITFAILVRNFACCSGSSCLVFRPSSIISVVKFSFIDKYGMDCILQPFIDEVKQLKSVNVMVIKHDVISFINTE